MHYDYAKHLDKIPAERQLRFMLNLLNEFDSGALEAKLKASLAILTPEERLQVDAEDRQDDLTDVGLGRMPAERRN